MSLFDVFPPEQIIIELESETKDELFEELVNRFCQTQKDGNREEILEALWQRENKMSTGIQKGIAIPHGKSPNLQNIHGVLGISKKGIDYDALDGQPVYIIFMLLAPKDDTEVHLRLLKRLAELLDNHEFYTELLTQRDPRGASQIIKKYEDIYISSE